MSVPSQALRDAIAAGTLLKPAKLCNGNYGTLKIKTKRKKKLSDCLATVINSLLEIIYQFISF